MVVARAAPSGAGGRAGFEAWITPDRWREQVEEALRQALVNLESIECPAGEMDVVLGAGWNGILLHEAVGHGLEGDFNRKGTSAFSGRIGEQVAARGVTVFDDGSVEGRRGSLDGGRRGDADLAHCPDRGRHSGGLYAGSPERPSSRHAHRPATAGASPTLISRCRA